MWINEYSFEINASETDIWKLLIDVENWKEWVGGVEYSTINGIFENGASGTTKNINGPKSTFCLKNVIVNKSFTIQLKLPFCTIEFPHEIINENRCLKVKLGVKLYGPLTFIFKKLIGEKAAKGLPVAAKKLVKLVENEIKS